MKKTIAIYSSIAIAMGLIILSYIRPSEILEEITIWYFVLFFSVAILVMILTPFLFWVFKLRSGDFKIKKGNHYSGYRLKFFINKKEQKVSVLFNDSCRYTGGIQLSEQINKLFGFGSIFIHYNSSRIGWKYNPYSDMIDLFLYEYEKGERSISHIQSIELNVRSSIMLTTEKKYIFGANCFPYFGGEDSAPHDININIKYL